VWKDLDNVKGSDREDNLDSRREDNKDCTEVVR
jgi:hypothetical protein